MGFVVVNRAHPVDSRFDIRLGLGIFRMGNNKTGDEHTVSFLEVLVLKSMWPKEVSLVFLMG